MRLLVNYKFCNIKFNTSISHIRSYIYINMYGFIYKKWKMKNRKIRIWRDRETEIERER